MNFSDLKKKLVLSDNKLALTRDSLTDNLSPIYDRYYAAAPLIITQATSKEESDKIVIGGMSSFTSYSESLSVVATFWVDDAGDVQMMIRYTLLDASPGPNAWNFSKSFPDMPTVPDWNRPYSDPGVNPLDSLYLFDSFFVLVSINSTDPAFSTPLKKGLNFIGKMRAEGLTGIIKSTFGQSEPVTLYGTVYPPIPGETVLPLVPFQYPWQFSDPLPGILLQADLGVDLSLGNASFGEVVFRLYIPLTKEWMEKNETHVPYTCFSGSLDIPSANIKADIVAPVIPGGTDLYLLGSFQGLSLKNLADMADLSGTGDLFSHLPADLAKTADALGQLQLMNAGIDFSYSNTNPGIAGATFTIGMPELNWKVWSDHFVIDSLSVRFDINSPMDKNRSIVVTMFGRMEIEGVEVDIFASTLDGFTVYASLGESVTLPLKKVLSTYAPSLPAPEDLTINALRVAVAPGKSYGMALAMANEPNPWKIPIGPTTLVISNLNMALTYPSSGSASGAFSGIITLGEFTMNFGYSLPGDFEIRAILPDIHLMQLADMLSGQSVSLPGGFDLQLDSSTVLIQKQSDNYTFMLGTQVRELGALAFQVQHINGQWGFAAGLDLSMARPSSVPGLGALSVFEDMFTLDSFLLVVCSFEQPQFQFPGLSKFNNPNITAKNITLPVQSGGVIPGLNLYAEWTLNTGSKQQALLRSFLGLDPTMSITLQVGENPAKNARFYVSYATKINGHPLSCKVGAQIQDGSPGLFMTGSMTVSIQNRDQTFDVNLLFVENGAFISATMKSQSSIDFSVFKIANLALEIGIDWEGIPSLGVAATIDISTFDSSVAVFFDSAEPSKSLVAGAVSDLSAADVLDALTGNAIPSEIDDVLDQIAIKGTHQFSLDGKLATDLDNLNIAPVAEAFSSVAKITIPSSSSQCLLIVNQKGKLWYLTDMLNMRHYALKKDGDSIVGSIEAQFYCAPQDTYIGTIRFPQGFYINGAIEFFGLKAEATIDISTNKGIAIDAQMDKLVIGTENLFSITADRGEGGPVISASTFSQPDQENEMFRSPHFYINGEITMLGLSKGIYASLGKSGFEFDLNGNLLPGISFDLHALISGSAGLDVGGDLKVGINSINLGPLGSLDIDTGVEAGAEFKVNGSDIISTIDAAFEFAGKTCEIAKFTLDVATAALKDLPDILWKKIKAFFEGLFEDVKKWAEAFAKGLVKGIEDAEKVIVEVYHKTVEEAKEILKSAEKVAKACATTAATLVM